MKQIEFKGEGDQKYRLAGSTRHGGMLFELYPREGDPVRRIFDQPKLRALIEDIEALCQFDVGNQVIRVDFADCDRLARFLERFL